MGFNEFLSSIFGNKSTRDMKEIQPWVEKITHRFLYCKGNSQTIL